MYTKLNLEDAAKLKNVKLCYIDEIDKTYYDYTPEAKVYRETDEWKEQNRLREEKFHREGYMSSDDPEFGPSNIILMRGSECQDYPNHEYIPGKQEYWAYFTPIDLEKQWGDDWDDSPYEHNAEIPYDDMYKGEERVETEIVKVPFYIPYSEEGDIRFPKDWGGYNSPFSVQDINSGAVAWIYDEWTRVAIQAGCTPKEFMDKINKINKEREE